MWTWEIKWWTPVFLWPNHATYPAISTQHARKVRKTFFLFQLNECGKPSYGMILRHFCMASASGDAKLYYTCRQHHDFTASIVFTAALTYFARLQASHLYIIVLWLFIIFIIIISITIIIIASVWVVCWYYYTQDIGEMICLDLDQNRDMCVFKDLILSVMNSEYLHIWHTCDKYIYIHSIGYIYFLRGCTPRIGVVAI